MSFFGWFSEFIPENPISGITTILHLFCMYKLTQRVCFCKCTMLVISRWWWVLPRKLVLGQKCNNHLQTTSFLPALISHEWTNVWSEIKWRVENIFWNIYKVDMAIGPNLMSYTTWVLFLDRHPAWRSQDPWKTGAETFPFCP